MNKTSQLQKRTFKNLSPLKITLIYAFISGVWILFSDKLLSVFISDLETFTQVQTFKGWFFVLITGGVLYVLIKRHISTIRHSENALRESQRFLSILMSNLPGMAYQCRNDRNWTMAFVSKGCFELTGYPPSDLIQNKKISYNELIHQDDQESVWNDAQVALQENEAFRIEYRIFTADGKEKWVWEQGRGVYSSEGNLLFIEGFITDVTKPKRVEKSLRETESALRTLHKIMSAQKLSFSEKIQALLVMGCQRFGLPVGILAHIEGEQYEVIEIVGPNNTIVKGNIFNVEKTFCNNTIQANEPISLEHVAKSEWNTHPAYAELKIEAYFGIPLVVGNQVYGTLNFSSFEPRQVLFTETDKEILKLMAQWVEGEIGRKLIEETLKSERNKAQKYLDVAGVIFVVVDAEQKVTLINNKGCEILGYDEKEIIGKNWFDTFLPATMRKEVKSVSEKLINGQIEPVEHYENPVLTKSGEERIIAWHNTILKDEEGNIIGTLSSGEDITEHRRSEELTKLQQQKLIQTDKMATLGILVSGVAHEINNPNNFILLNGKIVSKVWNDISPILNEHYENNGDFVLAGMPYTKAYEKIGQLISGISEGALRIQKIVQSLRDFARQDTGNLNQAVDLNSVVKSAITIVDNLIKKSTKRFSVEYGKNLPEIKGNIQQIEQVIINLITNSCQALQNREKSLTVSTSYDEDLDNIIIKVCDEGEGISPKDLNHIMDPFFTTKQDSGGTGLGLSVSYNIIKDHGGDLNFTSEHRKSTTAILTLPVN